MKCLLSLCVSALLLTGAGARGELFWLETLDLKHIEQGWGEPQAGKSVDGRPLFVSGSRYSHGLGTHAPSVFKLDLRGTAERITGAVGIDEEVEARGSVIFRVIGDSKELWNSGVVKGGEPARRFDLSLEGVQRLELRTEDGGDSKDFDHADWLDTQIIMHSGKPQAVAPPIEPAVVLTPKASPRPRINGPSVFGVRPRAPFLYTIPATGARPMRFAVKGLPPGLDLDPESGHITGQLSGKGVHRVRLIAENHLGKTEREFRIECGDQISLTPPMGWNSWNCFGCDVTEANVRAAADALVASGLSQHGWTYVNIDDCWQGKRGPDGNLAPNAKFGDLKALADYVHSRGLKIGIYSSPGVRTCASHEGSFGHELADARQYGEWGFDYLKYDWCSYGMQYPSPDLARMRAPYELMRQALDAVPRDIVYSLCQYGMGNVWEWGAQVGGNCWRTTGDITDTWSSMSGIGFAQAGREKYAGPGHWNDPDMLVLGQVGWSARLRPTRLTPDEQYTHMSLWCLLSAPLLIGCDLTRLDEFTLGLLTNDEVIAVNQDELGRQAARVRADGPLELWVKPMADGSRVAGLFNRGDEPASMSVSAAELGLKGKCAVRDLWRQWDLGSHAGPFTTTIPRHGVALLKFTPPSR